MISVPIWLFVIMLLPWGFFLLMLLSVIVQAIVVSHQERKHEKEMAEYLVIGKGEDEDNARE